MGSEQTVTTFTCDWVDEHGDTCGQSRAVSPSEGRTAWAVVNDEGWGSYTNAYVRRSRWTTGAELVFCPVHSTVFRNNHGWGGLEDYKPPRRWWLNIYRAKEQS